MSYASYYHPELHETLAPVTGNGFMKSMLAKFHNWRLRNETRRQLRRLPDHVLEDIGISRYQIENDMIRF